MQSKLLKKHFPLTILISLGLLIALARFHTYDEPFERDLMTYAVMAHEMLAGRELYSDLWDIKPPGIYLTYAAAELIAGYGPNSIYLLNIVAAIITLFGVYFAGTALTGGRRSGGLWAAACWAILAGELQLEANQPNTEVFMNACLIWVWVLFVKADWNFSYRKAIWIGLLIAWATLYKQIIIVTLFLLGGTYLIMLPAKLERRLALTQVMIMLGTVGIVWISVFSYFAILGRFKAFYDTIFIYNQYYAGSAVKNILRGLFIPQQLFPPFPQLAYPLIVLAIILGTLILFSRKRTWIFWLAYAVAIQIMVALPGKFFSHYYQLWLPLLAVGFGGAIIELGKIIKPIWISQLVATILIIALLYLHLPQYQLEPIEWSRKKYGDLFIITKNLAQEIDNLLQKDETFYEWGHHVGLYYYTQHRPPTGVFPTGALINGPLVQELSQRVIADLERNNPEMLILDHNPSVLKNQPLVLKWLFSKYTWIPIEIKTPAASNYFSVFARRGGHLESQLLINK
ncbi:hypothetical protein THII_0725 [Thioploca ingrica]|uniref:Uncharacterized protein n=1 Tax=Thioploca ingrica TaxID=40754 RepID=A0A090AI33_9GAMM|nr:hypothetical protein THII_0725 [Thioploca ingrica]